MTRHEYADNLEQMRRNLPQSTSFFRRWWGPVSKYDLVPELPWPGDPLMGFWQEQTRLLRTGRVVWSAMIQANLLLFSPGAQIAPGEVVAGFDAELDADPEILIRTAQRIYALKGTQPDSPELRVVADHITDEFYRARAERLPDEITENHALFRFTVLFYPKHLPDGFLNGKLLPLLVHPRCQHAMVLPHWYWSKPLLKEWQLSEEQRSQIKSPAERRATEPMVYVSLQAMEAIRGFMNQHGVHQDSIYVRLEINGARVSLDLHDEITASDYSLQIDGLTFVFDTQTADNYWGSRIDYIDDGHTRGFSVQT